MHSANIYNPSAPKGDGRWRYENPWKLLGQLSNTGGCPLTINHMSWSTYTHIHTPKFKVPITWIHVQLTYLFFSFLLKNFKLFFRFIFFSGFECVACMSVCARHVPGARGSSEPPWGPWESNPGPLHEQQVLLTTKPALQPHSLLFSHSPLAH